MFNEKGFENAEDVDVPMGMVDGDGDGLLESAAAEVENGSRPSIEGYFEAAGKGEGLIHCPNISFTEELPGAAGRVTDRDGAPGTEKADSKLLLLTAPFRWLAFPFPNAF